MKNLVKHPHRIEYDLIQLMSSPNAILILPLLELYALIVKSASLF